MTQTGIFEGRTRVRYGYSCFGYTRGGGTIWHGGSDEEGLDSDRILMPYYNAADGTKKPISGKVIQARIVTNKSNLTWEWGWYVTVQLDANQTPDEANFFEFCHNAENLVKIGQTVRSGDVLAVMGNSGNAAQANPPFKHCHFEVRATASGRGIDPTAYTGHPNKPGTYGSNEENGQEVETMNPDEWKTIQLVTLAPLTDDEMREVDALADNLGIRDSNRYNQVRVDDSHFAAIATVSSGDAMKFMAIAEKNGWDKQKRYHSRFVG